MASFRSGVCAFALLLGLLAPCVVLSGTPLVSASWYVHVETEQVSHARFDYSMNGFQWFEGTAPLDLGPFEASFDLHLKCREGYLTNGVVYKFDHWEIDGVESGTSQDLVTNVDKGTTITLVYVEGPHKAPDFVLTDLSGGQVILSNLLGKVVLLEFFSPGCQFSVDQVPHLKAVYSRYSPDHFAIVSIGWFTDSEQSLHDFVQQYEIPWTVARDYVQGVYLSYYVVAVPHIFVLDPSGYIRHVHAGVADQSVLRGEIDILIGQVSYAAAITGVTVVPDSSGVDQGSKMTFTINVQNTGAKDMSSARVQLKILKPGGRVASSPSKTISRFIAGSTRPIQITYNLPKSAPTGDWTYGVYVYRSSTLLDSETDGGFKVRVPSGVIVSVADSPDPVTRGTTASFTVTMKNTGNLVWSSARITIKIFKPDGRLAKTLTITARSIQPGIEYTYTKDWRISTSAPIGTYSYSVYLTYGSTAIASNIGNTITVN